MLGSLVRNLLQLPLNSFIENLSYPALLLFVLVLLGHSTGLIAPPGGRGIWRAAPPAARPGLRSCPARPISWTGPTRWSRLRPEWLVTPSREERAA